MEYRINLTDDTAEKLGRAMGAPIQELEQEILEKEEQVAELEDTVEEKQAIIDAFPTIEALSVTQNGTYNEEGKAYKPVTVNVPGGYEALSLRMTVVNNTGDMLHIPYISFYETGNEVLTSIDYTNTVNGGVASLSYTLPKSNNKSKVRLQLRGTGGGRTINVTTSATGVTVTAQINYIDVVIDLSTYINDSLIAFTVS